MDDVDRRIISLLQSDSRTPVSRLADVLGISRATAQARIDRLRSRGVIRRFTVDLGIDDEREVRALCMVQLTHSSTRSVLRKLQDMHTIHEVHTTNGKWDLVVSIRADSLTGLDETLAGLRQLPVVQNTETSILLRRL